MRAIARTRYLKGSPRKARLVIDLIRGKSVPQALAILGFTNKRAARPIEKTLLSAVANATYKAEQENIAIDPADLYVSTCYVDMGPTKHRWRIRPAPQGRAYRERRHYCHITIEVSTEKEVRNDKKAEKKNTKQETKVEARGKETAEKEVSEKKAFTEKKPEERFEVSEQKDLRESEVLEEKETEEKS
jgi:large subunit ribosomal protein L22